MRRHFHHHSSHRNLFAGVRALALASLTLVACEHAQSVLDLKNAKRPPPELNGTGANGGILQGSCLDLAATETDLGTTDNGGAPGFVDEENRVSCSDAPCSPAYIPNSADVDQAQSWLEQMNPDDKVIQLTGIIPIPQPTDSTRFRDIQRSLDVDHDALHIRGMLWRDGPHGLNLEAGVNAQGHPDYATSFPTSVGQGATFDVDLLTQVGAAMGDEVVASGNMILLAPCMNILRHPFWGRANETFGEDTFHLGRVATAITLGLQKYVSGCAKHFAANNIENQRWLDDAVMDEQTLHEIYGRHFEMVVHDGGVGCVMASYNMVNGTKSTQNAHLLTDMLRNDMGFKGFVVSDWWAMPGYQDLTIAAPQDETDAAQALMAGLSVEVPWAIHFKAVTKAMDDGTLDPKYVDDAVLRVLEQKLRFHEADLTDKSLVGLKPPTTTYDPDNRIIGNNDAHLDLAEKLAEESMVLLKNDNNTLPIPSSTKTVAVIGLQVPYTVISDHPSNHTFDFVNNAALGDRGSSRVSADPGQTVSPLQGITAAAPAGVTVVSGSTADVATNADLAVVIVGLTPGDQGEEYTGAKDRNTINLPGGHDQLINDVVGKGKPTVVVIESGSVVAMPWIDQVKAVVMAWFPGQRGGTAMGRLLFRQAEANFSGRLPVTWYRDDSQLPTFSENVPGPTNMDYFLGYRRMDQIGDKPLFAFGYGLSYSTFRYDRLRIPCSDVTENGIIRVDVDVRNTSDIPGDEVTLVFASYPNPGGRRSKKELKGFARFHLDAKQAKRISIPVRVQDLKYWPDPNKQTNGWVVDKGPVLIQVGPSSDNLPLQQTFTVK